MNKRSLTSQASLHHLAASFPSFQTVHMLVNLGWIFYRTLIEDKEDEEKISPFHVFS